MQEADKNEEQGDAFSELSEGSSLDLYAHVDVRLDVVVVVVKEELEKFRAFHANFQRQIETDMQRLKKDIGDYVDSQLLSKCADMERRLCDSLASADKIIARSLREFEAKHLAAHNMLLAKLDGLLHDESAAKAESPSLLQQKGDPPQLASSAGENLEQSDVASLDLSLHPCSSQLGLSSVSASPADASAPAPTADPVPPSPALLLTDLPADVAFLMMPFLSRRHSAQEKLSALQNAFFLWKMEDLGITDTKNLMARASAIKKAGEDLRIWLPGFRPRGTATLTEFLAEKIKTVLKKKRRSSLIEAELKSKLQKMLQRD